MREAEAIVDRLAGAADRLLKNAQVEGRPLLVDALWADGGGWVADEGAIRSGHVLSNFASKQTFLRFLWGLTAVTGDGSHATAARDLAAYALSSLSDPSGLLYWGGHVAFDVDEGRVVGSHPKHWYHELKCEFPFYGLLFEVDPESTRRFVEALWSAHVLDWSRLDFDRHGLYGASRGSPWNHEYEGGPVPFWGDGLGFATAAADLYYAGAMLYQATGDAASLLWSKRLAARFVETRADGIGLSAYQFNRKATAFCDGRAVRGDRAQYQIGPLLSPGNAVYETSLFRPRPAVQRCQIEIGRRLGEPGREFTHWAVTEVEAWARVAYRAEANAFLPMLTDGRRLDGLVLQRKGYFGPAGRRLAPIPGSPDFLWVYAAAYRDSPSDLLWDTARHLARGAGLGDIGEPDGSGRALRPVEEPDAQSLYALLELHRATGDDEFLARSLTAADRLARNLEPVGGIPTGDRVALEDARPLAALHVAATALGRGDVVPPFLGVAGKPAW